jgi:hypothetical protein
MSKKAGGRPALGERPMTMAERRQRSKEAHIAAGGTRREFWLSADADRALADAREQLGVATLKDAVERLILEGARRLKSEGQQQAA